MVSSAWRYQKRMTLGGGGVRGSGGGHVRGGTL
jgi:hypothetical protein